MIIGFLGFLIFMVIFFIMGYIVTGWVVDKVRGK